MSDYALIEAMAVHMTSHLAVGYRDAKLYALYALAVARPIIEAQERERCASFVRKWFGEGSYKGAGVALAAALKETGDE